MATPTLSSRANVSKPRSVSAAERTFFSVVGIFSALIVSFYAFTMLRMGSNCPNRTFWSGLELSTGALLTGLFACFLCIFVTATWFAPVLLWTELLPETSLVCRVRRYRARTACVAACCALVAALCWYVVAGSSFCLSADSILIRTPFAADETHPWSDVKAIVSDCSITKNRRYGGLVLQLNNARSLSLSFQTDRFDAFDELRMALSQIGYFYRAGYSVTANRCPPELLPVLLNWGHEGSRQ